MKNNDTRYAIGFRTLPNGLTLISGTYARAEDAQATAARFSVAAHHQVNYQVFEIRPYAPMPESGGWDEPKASPNPPASPPSSQS